MNNINLTKLTKGVLATFLFSTLVACGNRRDNNNQNINAYNQSCAVNCEGISGYPFFTAQTQALRQGYGYSYGYTTAMAISWSFSGQNISNQTQNQNYNQYAPPAMNYVGKVSAAGQVSVVTALSDMGLCPQIPAGTYNLTTHTGGQWQNGQISGLRILITGPVTITATLSNAQATQSGYGGGGGYYGGGGGYGGYPYGSPYGYGGTYGGYSGGAQYGNQYGGQQPSTGNRIIGNLIIEQVNGYFCQGVQLLLN